MIRQERRALTHVGGDVVRFGSEPESRALAHALDVAPSHQVGEAPRDDAADDPGRVHMHGFHVYPARMHPQTASRLVAIASDASGVVLDPFCGSGTVLIEAMIARRGAIGTDLNPLAALLATRKVAPRSASHVERLLVAAAAVKASADERRLARAGAHRRYGKEDVESFDPHVLLELDSLRAAVALQDDHAIRDDLRLVLSAILIKVSRRRGDTSSLPSAGPKRIAAGYPAKLFVRKTEELVKRAAELEARLLPPPRPRGRVAVDDARELRAVRPGEASAVVTSPPYVGTYDYLAHHALRLRWLGLHTDRFERGEIGSRRKFSRGGDDAVVHWERELGASLTAIHRALRPRSRVAFVIADSDLGGKPVRANETLGEVGSRTGFRFIARASQARPHFHLPGNDRHRERTFARMPRFEHAILLERV